MHSIHALTSFQEERACKQRLPAQHCWHITSLHVCSGAHLHEQSVRTSLELHMRVSFPKGIPLTSAAFLHRCTAGKAIVGPHSLRSVSGSNCCHMESRSSSVMSRELSSEVPLVNNNGVTQEPLMERTIDAFRHVAYTNNSTYTRILCQ